MTLELDVESHHDEEKNKLQLYSAFQEIVEYLKNVYVHVFAFECNTKIFFGILLKIQLNFPKK